MESGKTVALVTNAGTPCISDPGFRLVRAAIDAGIGVSMVPGPSAFLMAVALSGLPVHSFTFRGFPPRKQGPRKRFFEVDRNCPHTLVFYESPYRLVKSMQDALDVFGDRQAAVANELTKIHEEIRRGALSELLAGLRDENVRGEYVVVIAGDVPSPKQGHLHDG
jgi:16S rRNA (cytidine1402-2'-O)-methyltransferase